jgi:hypothetical protein
MTAYAHDLLRQAHPGPGAKGEAASLAADIDGALGAVTPPAPAAPAPVSGLWVEG